MDETSLNDLELELRMLPGVRAAGFDHRDDVLFVQLHVGDHPEAPESMAATRIAARHSDGAVAVEIARWRTVEQAFRAIENEDDGDGDEVAFVDLTSDLPLDEDRSDAEDERPAVGPHRPRLLAVLVFPDTDELEVHLIHDGRRTIGRAPASRGLVGAVEATIAAIRGLGAEIEPRAKWARALESNGDGRELVAVAIASDDAMPVNYGLAAGASAIDAAARSTLDALNRQLARVL